MEVSVATSTLLDEQAKDNLDRDVLRITSISIIEYIF